MCIPVPVLYASPGSYSFTFEVDSDEVVTSGDVNLTDPQRRIGSMEDSMEAAIQITGLLMGAGFFLQIAGSATRRKYQSP